ncbi:MAG: DUF5652 family protein [archaeon]
MVGLMFWGVISLVVIAEFVLKGLALWKAGNNKQGIWYTFMYIFSTAGILPLIYLLFFQKKKREEREAPKRRRRR